METSKTEESPIENEDLAVKGKFGKHDIFQDPALTETLKDDPLFRFFKQYWTQIAMVAVAVVVGVYAKGAFEETYRNEMGRSADIFLSVQESLGSIPLLQSKLDKALAEEAKATDNKEEKSKLVAQAREELQQAKSRAETLLTSLSDTKQPYAGMANLYRGLLSLQASDISAAQSTMNIDRWSSIVDGKSADRFYAEIEAFALARAQLDLAEKYAAARGQLKALAENGQHVDVMAALVLARTSLTPEEQREARSVIEKVKERSPEQTVILDPSLEQLAK